ncbi:MAG: hypothetical protein P4L54_02420 [Acidocella sp.]|nr:hypothetical protein [Acidocella sp.]
MKPFLMGLLLAGCAQAAPPVTRIVTVMPVIPASLLHCAPAPDVPVASSQSMVARYIVALWQAGQDCRAHVAAIAQATVMP